MKLKNLFKKVIVSTLIGAMTIQATGEYVPVSYVETVEAASVEIRENVNSKLKSGNVLIGVQGKDYTSNVSDVLKTINQVRYDACKEGVINPATGKPLTLNDYKPLKIGKLCTKAAKIRAVEASLYLDHVRPNGEEPFAVIYGLNGSEYGLGWVGENLAWYPDEKTSIEGWIDEKDDYVNNVANAMIGHYEALISTNYNYIGISSFNPDYDTQKWNWTCTEATFAGNDTEVTPETAKNGAPVLAKVEVSLSKTFNQCISGNAMAYIGDKNKYEVLVSYDNKQGGNMASKIYDCPVYDKVTWKSSDESVLKYNGTSFEALKLGRVTLTATVGEGSNALTLTKDVMVVNKNTVIDHVESLGKITVESYEKPVLPKTANVVLSDGSKIAVDVTWDSYDESLVKTNLKSKEFTINGNAYGYDVKQVIHVNAAYVTKILAYDVEGEFIKEIKVPSGTKPVLPQYGYVVLSNGLAYHSCKLTWEDTDVYKNREGGRYIIKAKTPNYFDTDDGYKSFDIEINLIVDPAYAVSEKLEFVEKTIKYKGTYTLPKMEVVWSNGDESVEEVTWNLSKDKIKKINEIISNVDGGSFKITGKYDGKSVTVKYTVAKKGAKVTNKTDSSKSGKSNSTSKKASKGIALAHRKGKILKDKRFIYKVIKPASKNGKIVGKLKVIKLRKKSLKKVRIPSTKKFNGAKYKVTAIGKKVFKKLRKGVKLRMPKRLYKKYKKIIKRYKKLIKKGELMLTFFIL